MLILIKLATWLLSPLGMTLSFIALGLVVRRVRIVLFAIAALTLGLFSSYWVSHGLLLSNLEQKARQLQLRAKPLRDDEKPTAIVVLGGGLLAAAPPERPHPDLLPAADRVWHAARLFHDKRANLVILTGGQRVGLEGSGLQSEAESMKLFLRDLGVPESAIVIEDQSRTTRENASKTRDLISKLNPRSESERQLILLVTSASHMPRAVRNYEQVGFKVIPESAEYNAVGSTLAGWEKLLPNESNLATSSSAIKEWIALTVGY